MARETGQTGVATMTRVILHFISGQREPGSGGRYAEVFDSRAVATAVAAQADK